MKDENIIDDEAVRKMAANIAEIVEDCTNIYDAVDEVKGYLTMTLTGKTIMLSKNNKN